MADTFMPANRLDEADRVYPLICDLCPSCGQVQLRTVTSPAERYSEYDYSYTSSNSRTSQNHWIEYAGTVGAAIGLKRDDAVLEIGSNDGFLTEQFQKLGCTALGVDPSPAMARLAAERGVNTLTAFSARPAPAMSKKPWAGSRGSLPPIMCSIMPMSRWNSLWGSRRCWRRRASLFLNCPIGCNRSCNGNSIRSITSTSATSPSNTLSICSTRHDVNHVEEVDYHGGSIRVLSGTSPWRFR